MLNSHLFLQGSYFLNECINEVWCMVVMVMVLAEMAPKRSFCLPLPLKSTECAECNFAFLPTGT